MLKTACGNGFPLNIPSVIPESGGSGGTSDYSELSNKPSINSVTLSGNKTAADLGLASADIEDLIPADASSSNQLATAADLPGLATTSAPGIVQPDGTTVTITDGVISAVGSGSGGVNYSTTEHVIGTWIDGSTLYERTYYIDSFPSGGTTTMEKLVDTGFTPSQIAIRYGEGVGYSSSGSIYPLPYLNGGTSTDVQYEIGFAFVSRDSHLYIFLRSAYNYSNVTGYVTMRYTKSAN